MLRNVLGVIAGYVFVAIFTIACLFVVYAVFGTNWAFKPESFQASTRWSLASVVFGLIGAVAAGFICRKISNSAGAVKFLAGLFLVLGLSLAVFTLMQPKPTEKRPAEMSFMQAGEKAYSPDWYNFVIPFVGAVGAMIGGNGLRETRTTESG